MVPQTLGGVLRCCEWLVEVLEKEAEDVGVYHRIILCTADCLYSRDYHRFCPAGNRNRAMPTQPMYYGYPAVVRSV